MTPHNEAKEGDIAKIVIMSGDPLRIKYIAETYLDKPKLVNSIRGMYAYTGKYKGKLLTVMAHGMGMPSAGIYVYELFKYYNVDKIIRLGSCGAYDKNLDLLDIILVDKSYTESNYSYTLNNEHVNIIKSSLKINKKLENAASKLNIKLHKGTVISSDCFDWYMTDLNKFLKRVPKKYNVIAAEMESFAIFYIARLFKKEASCLLTVVDSHNLKTEVSQKERETSLNNMIKVALESILED